MREWVYSISTQGWFPDDDDDTAGVVEEEADGVWDASRNWAKDGVGLLQRGRRHLAAIHDSCN